MTKLFTQPNIKVQLVRNVSASSDRPEILSG